MDQVYKNRTIKMQKQEDNKEVPIHNGDGLPTKVGPAAFGGWPTFVGNIMVGYFFIVLRFLHIWYRFLAIC
jgi:hypothetical protein